MIVRSPSLIRRIGAFCAALIGAIAVSGAAYAAKPETYTAILSNVGAGGYDVVAYFSDGAPVKGDAALKTDYKGAEWRFSSAANLEKFKADPDAYAPQYGGYCAWAVAQDYTAPGNPKNWAVVDGKLYLNYNDKVQADWLKDVPGFIASANANWPDVLQK
ncbi:MAG: YHS domain-containing (seleno)protein [Parvularculaceae bacterium]